MVANSNRLVHYLLNLCANNLTTTPTGTIFAINLKILPALVVAGLWLYLVAALVNKFSINSFSILLNFWIRNPVVSNNNSFIKSTF